MIFFEELWSKDLTYEEKAREFYDVTNHTYIDEDKGIRLEDVDIYRRDVLRYFFDDGRCIIFDNYEIDTDRVITRKTGNSSPFPYKKKGTNYFVFKVRKDGEEHKLRLGRAMASTFIGPPPTLGHTVDHIISENEDDDSLANLRWLDKSGQTKNRVVPETRRSAFLIVNEHFPGDEGTAKEWVEVIKKDDGSDYVYRMFQRWARNGWYGFSYKDYPDIDDEEWKMYGNIEEDHVQISNKSRIKDVTYSRSGRVEHVLNANQLQLWGGYPSKQIGYKKYRVHVIVYQLWYPEKWASKKAYEVVRHLNDDPFDFRPENLELGTQSQNMMDAYDNGRYDGTATERKSVVAYDDDVEIGRFESQCAAARYLVSIADDNDVELKVGVAQSGIRCALDKNKTYCDLSWKSV